MVRRLSIAMTALALINLSLCGPTFGGSPIPRDGGSKHVKAGVKTWIRTYYNCNPGNALPGFSGLADHGKIEVQQGTFNKCNNPHQPVEFIYYTSQLGFVGTDEISIYDGRFSLRMEIVVE